MPHRSLCALRLALAVLCLALAACGSSEPGFVDGGPLDATLADVTYNERPPLVDAGNVMDVRGRACTRSSQCDDGVDCTEDFCADDGRCVSAAVDSRCDDSLYCNGVETCDARRGCVRGTPVTCNDNFTCTIDRCDEATHGCDHRPRDFDGDGDPDIHCQAPECDAGVPDPPCWRGGDCDDDNPRVNSLLPEICGDGIDNNCNGEIDDADHTGCSRPMYDRCDDALDVSAGGRFTVSLAGALGDYPSRCVGNTVPTHDAVLHLVLDAPHDLAITSDTNAVMLQLGTQCGSLTGVLDCISGYPTVYRARALPAGEYFVQVAYSGAVPGNGDVSLQVDLTDPTPDPVNDHCAGAIDIPAGGGSATGTLVDVSDDVTTSCGGLSPDLVYRLTLTEARDVTLRATGGRSDYLTVSLVDQCSPSARTLRCANGAPATARIGNVPPGTYYVVVEGVRVASFTLDVSVATPVPPVPGDTCANPITLPPNTTVMGTVTGAQPDINTTCSAGDNRDVVYRFTLDRTLDVTAVVRGADSDFYFLAVQRACGDTTREVACRYGAVGRLTARGLDPGDYYLVIRPLRGTDFSVSLATGPALAPVAVTGNDTCATAQAIPSGGGYYQGNTATLRRDYTAPCTLGATSEDAVFHYTSDVRQRVQFSLEGTSFNAIVWIAQGPMCPGSSVPGTCFSGEGGSLPVFDTVLEAGEYWVFVAGFNADARGNYSLAVQPLPM